MAIIVSGLKLDFEAGHGDALAAACRRLGVGAAGVGRWRVARISLDLRRGALRKVFSVELDLGRREADFLARGWPDVRPAPSDEMPRPTGKNKLTGPPLIIGFGPAGLFAALVLAENGYEPHVVERGGPMEARDAAVEGFFGGGALDTQCNIQFGEGGAGAYSDGKLTTRINDSRCALAFRLLGEFGAPREALVAQRPHIGTDLLKGIVVAMRRRIIHLGGRVDFFTRARGFAVSNGRLGGVDTSRGAIGCDTAVLAIGHSARDTFLHAARAGLPMEAKAFSVGVRIEHPQEVIDRGLYGPMAGTEGLPPGEYTLSHRVGGRGCYSFCMCPGGQVVAAASEEGGLVTNGMSFHARDGKNANAALCVGVGPGDFGNGAMDGVAFQRRLEQAAFKAGGGDFSAPVQRLEDFCTGRAGAGPGLVQPTYPRGYRVADLNGILPAFVAEGIKASVAEFGRKISGFDMGDAVLTGVETRTSSPVRILRGDNLESPAAAGLIPCGEGAGYAGGIISAAVDGIRAAERIMEQYAPLR